MQPFGAQEMLMGSGEGDDTDELDEEIGELQPDVSPNANPIARKRLNRIAGFIVPTMVVSFQAKTRARLDPTQRRRLVLRSRNLNPGIPCQ